MISLSHASAPSEASTPDRWFATDPTLLPAMRHGYRTPESGLTRVQALQQGLDPSWRLVASADSSARQYGLYGRGAFTAHLLVSETRTAVTVVWDEDWLGRDRDVLETMLDLSVVEETLAGLVRRFSTATRLPIRPRHVDSTSRPVFSTAAQHRPAWSDEMRLDVLVFLLEQDFDGKDAESMLLDLALGAGAIEQHRQTVQVEVARKKAYAQVERRFVALVRHAKDAGILDRGAYKAQMGEIALRNLLRAQFDDERTTVPDESFAAAEEQVYRDYFGDVLDDVRASRAAAEAGTTQIASP